MPQNSKEIPHLSNQFNRTGQEELGSANTDNALSEVNSTVRAEHVVFPGGIRWELHPKLQELLSAGHVEVGGIIGAGHMPTSLTDQDYAAAGLAGEKFDPRNHQFTRTQIARMVLERQRRQEQGEKVGPIRFVDTNSHVEAQIDAIYLTLKRQYDAAIKRNSDAQYVMYAVSAFSAGFDNNYFEAIERLKEEIASEKEKDNTKPDVVFTIFVPFDRASVTSYSSDNGLNRSRYVDSWQRLLGKSDDANNLIFVHEPRAENGETFNVDQARTLGDRYYKDPSALYSLVNVQMLAFALMAAGGNVSRLVGVFGETFQDSKTALGGAPEIMAALRLLGASMSQLYIIQQGLNPLTVDSIRQALNLEETVTVDEMLSLLQAEENKDTHESLLEQAARIPEENLYDLIEARTRGAASAMNGPQHDWIWLLAYLYANHQKTK